MVPARKGGWVSCQVGRATWQTAKRVHHGPALGHASAFTSSIYQTSRLTGSEKKKIICLQMRLAGRSHLHLIWIHRIGDLTWYSIDNNAEITRSKGRSQTDLHGNRCEQINTTPGPVPLCQYYHYILLGPIFIKLSVGLSTVWYQALASP